MHTRPRFSIFKLSTLIELTKEGNDQCISIAPTIVTNCVKVMSAAPFVFQAGYIVNVTMVSLFSSIFVITFGITQCVADSSDDTFAAVEATRNESVVTITGKVVKRTDETINTNLPTGHIEVRIESYEVQSAAALLPLQVNSDEDAGEETRLRYRYLDLRRQRPHNNIMLRAEVIQSIRRRMVDLGFMEFQTPILTASSPEGARDFLVPSRLHPGKFYALPQAPQQFKQLIMVSGFDKYFQIAPVSVTKIVVLTEVLASFISLT